MKKALSATAAAVGMAVPATLALLAFSAGTATAGGLGSSCGGSGWSQPGWGSQPPGYGQTVCPTAAGLGAASNYNEFAFGNITQGQTAGDDAEGNVAAGGSVNFTHFYVGAETGAKDALVVGGNVTVNDGFGLLSGSTGVYGGSINTPEAGLTRGPAPFSFAQVQQQVTQNSQIWGQDPQTSGATVVANGSLLYLTGTASGLNVFDLKAGQFGAAQTIFIKVPAGATVLVNVPDTNLTSTPYQDIQYWDGSAYESGSQYNSATVDAIRNSTMFNFPAARTLGFQNAEFAGTIVAPQATVTFNSGQLDGNLIANNISGNFESEYDPAFVGCTTPPPPPCPNGGYGNGWSRGYGSSWGSGYGSGSYGSGGGWSGSW